jgi:hypothetical protein
LDRRRQVLVAALFAVITFAVLLIAIWADNVFSPDYIAPTDIESVNSHYLIGPSGNESRIS